MRPASRPGPFDRRLLGALGVLAFLCFAWAVIAALQAPAESHDAEGDDVYGRGPFGFRGLIETLERLDHPVRIHRRPLETAEGDVLRIVALPELSVEARQVLRHALGEIRQGTTLLVLPKWKRSLDAEGRPIAQAFTGEALDEVTRNLRLAARVEVWPAGEAVASAVLLADGDDDASSDEAPGPALTPRLRAPRSLVGPSDSNRCVLTASARCLAMQTVVDSAPEGDHRIVVLAEPDLFDNFGFVQGDNAAIGVSLVLRLAAGRPIVFDASLHGYTVPELWASLLEPPLLFPVLQLLLMGALWAWSGARRFGAPALEPPPLGAGRHVLVENTVELLHQGGHAAHMLGRYWQTTVRDMARQLRLPGEQHPARLRAVGVALNRPDAVAALDADVVDAAARRLDARALFRLVRRINVLRAAALASRAAPASSSPDTPPEARA